MWRALTNEGRVLYADYGQFVLLNVYFPNGRSSAERLKYKMDFYDAFLEFTDKIVREGKNVVICGDVNTAHKEIDLRAKANEKPRLSARGASLDRPTLGSWVCRHFPDVQPRTGAIHLWDQMSRARETKRRLEIDYFFVNQAFAGKVKAAFILLTSWARTLSGGSRDRMKERLRFSSLQQPYIDVTDENLAAYNSGRLDLSQHLLRSEKAHSLYNQYHEQYSLADEVGI